MSKEEKVYFAENLKKLRKEKNLNQTQLGAIFGVTKVTISAWENNRQEPDFATLKKIARYFHVSETYILNNEEDSGQGKFIFLSPLEEQLLGIFRSYAREFNK